MSAQRDKSIYYRLLVWAALAMALACGAANPVFGQETVAGKFALAETTRFGSTLLPAGHYQFTIEPAGTLLSVNSIQTAGHVTLVVVRPESKDGPVAAVLAMASRSKHGPEESELLLTRESSSAVARSLYLKDGLEVELDWAAQKEKGQTAAQVTARPQPATTARTAD